MLPLAAVLRPVLGLHVGYGGYAGATGAGYAADGSATGGTSWPESGWPVLGMGMVHVGLLAMALSAFRMPRPAGRRPLRHEAANAAALVGATWLGASLAHLAGALWAAGSEAAMNQGSQAGQAARAALAESLGFAHAAPFLGLVTAAAAGLTYPAARGVVLFWPRWKRLRRTRLLWALTHAQLVGSMALAGGVAVALTAAGARWFRPPFGPEILPPDAPAVVFAVTWVTTRLAPFVTALLLMGVMASAVVLPPAVLISFLVLRRPARRLEDLATTAGALRAGDLAARVPIGGEDEVGRLQTDFNAMAADLETTLQSLQGERDRVAGLLEARRQLVAGVSHELRTPVATIRGYLEPARRREAVPAALRPDLLTVEHEVVRLQHLIEDLFTLSRAEVGRLDLRPAPTEVAAAVRGLVATVAPLAWSRRRVRVLAETPGDLPPARADAQRLEQIVSNLLGNAVRHTPPGGLVAAAVAGRADAVCVEVRDTGEGIAPEHLPHVFERFYRKPAAAAVEHDGTLAAGGVADGVDDRLDGSIDGRDGAGLGLALVKELTEAMGGTVAVVSTPGEGSCFTVRLPRA
jgi:signal transduction histidine kinase